MELRRALPEKKYFKIGEVADLVGVEPHVLRYWETQFPQVRPHKARSGHRLYRRREVEALLVIRELLHVQRFTIAGARQALRQPGGWSSLVPRFFDAPDLLDGARAALEQRAGGHGADERGAGEQGAEEQGAEEQGAEEYDVENDQHGPSELTDPDGAPVESDELVEDEARVSLGSGPPVHVSSEVPARTVERGFALAGKLDDRRTALLEGALADARLILALLDRDDARERVHP